MDKRIVVEFTGKMTQICRKIVRVNIKWSLLERVSIFKEFLRFIWDGIVACSVGKHIRYRRLSRRNSSLAPEEIEAGIVSDDANSVRFSGYESDSDLVSLKISLLGDCQNWKTSFLIKYVGDEREKKSLHMSGLNLMDKTLSVKGARIAFSIWDVGGDHGSLDHVPIACKDAVAILFMFDLTSRCTLNSVIGWYSQARKYNQLPPDLQCTIISQAITYARAMQAALFFSSARHKINVDKIFKFIMAKLFNLPWTLERNLTVGEPIIKTLLSPLYHT
ncbi:Small GTPase, partial [Dillenia turbinata]